MITITVDNVYCKIVGLTNQAIINKLDSVLSYVVVGYEFSPAFTRGIWNTKKNKWERWDGRRRLLDKQLRFLRGLLPMVEAILSNNGIEYKIDDKRIKIPLNEPIPMKNVEVRPYQLRVLETALKSCGGVIKSATGSGKSIMIAQIIANTNLKTMVYVVGIDLLYQMKETFDKVLGVDVGIIGDGKSDIKDINICTVWTAANALGQKYTPIDDEDPCKKELLNRENQGKIVSAIKSAEVIFFDECHMLACQTLQAINVNSKNAYYKWALSGTPFRSDGADLLVDAVCGKPIIDITASELINDNYLVKPVIHFIDVPQMDFNADKYQSIYKQYIVENDERNSKIIKAASKLVDSGRKVLILIKNIKHGNILLDNIPSKYVAYFVRGELDSETRNNIRQAFKENKIHILIASAVYDQGIDIPMLDALILGGSGKSVTRCLQRIGRVIRPYPGKDNAIVVDFIDNAKYLYNHSKERLKIYKLEQGFEIKLPQRKLQDDTSGKKKKTSKRLQSKNPKLPMSW